MCPKTGLQSSRGRFPPPVTINRLCPDAAGAPLGLRRALQVEPGSTTGPQRARTGRSLALHSSAPSGLLLTSPGSSGRRKTAPQGCPGSGARPLPCTTPHSCATPRPKPAGPAHTVAAQLRRGPAQKAGSQPDGLKAAWAPVRLLAGQRSSSVPPSGDG
ncbi:hypothetical protein NDU88_001258 [Pleurodeles waltl]|uniref:Uncharacterized protein n=1 Tax=Pleurodeles waltl TaxID=8319 RepID=A0AAV7KS64_PLEWA|nr:hypothetical protein NDU88_001258 [Pleurodeles waltl]